MFASLAFAALLGGPDALPTPALRPDDRRADCPAWLADAMADQGGTRPEQAACIWTDTSDQAQQHYVEQLRQAGWSNAGGEANVLKFRKGDACIGLAGFPATLPGSEAIGSDRDLRQGRPAAQPAVLLILRDEKGACASAGAR